MSLDPLEPGPVSRGIEALIKAAGIDFGIGGSRAFYLPSEGTSSDFGRVGEPAGRAVRTIVHIPHGPELASGEEFNEATI